MVLRAEGSGKKPGPKRPRTSCPAPGWRRRERGFEGLCALVVPHSVISVARKKMVTKVKQTPVHNARCAYTICRVEGVERDELFPPRFLKRSRAALAF